MRDFFKKLGTKVQLILGILVGVLGFVLYGVLKKKQDPKDMVEYKMDKIKSDMEIDKIDEKSKEGVDKIKSLDRQGARLRKKLNKLDDKVPDDKSSTKEVDDFFKKRGF